MKVGLDGAGWYAGYALLPPAPLWPPRVKPKSLWKRVTRPLRMRKAQRLLNRRVVFRWKSIAVPIVISGLEETEAMTSTPWVKGRWRLSEPPRDVETWECTRCGGALTVTGVPEMLDGVWEKFQQQHADCQERKGER